MFGEKEKPEKNRTFFCPECEGEWVEDELEEGDGSCEATIGFCPHCGYEFIDDEEHEDDIGEI